MALWLTAVAIVAVGELLPADSAPIRVLGSVGFSDKALHFCAYVALAAIPAVSFYPLTGVLLALSMILLGVALEFVQKLVPGRGFEVADMVANTLGTFAGIAAGLAARLAWRCVPGR